jgi:peptidoglycan/LPS O-acetylase OafA/YrhL
VAITVVPFTLVIAAAAVRDIEGRSTAFSRRTWIKLGEWSFAFYLLHTLVLNVERELLPDQKSVPTMIAALVFALILSIGLSAAVHELYERPLERRLRGARRQSELAF